jgi:hypothetical protein
VPLRPRRRDADLAGGAFCAAEQARLLPGQEPRSITLSYVRTRKEKEIIKDLAGELVILYEVKRQRDRRASAEYTRARLGTRSVIQRGRQRLR